MSLTDFKPQFDNAYQEIFLKVLVSMKIANTRFKSTLKFGESIERVLYDIGGVIVRDVTRGSASTIDSVTDTSELLLVNIEKEAVFHISDGEVTQAGPLNPGEVIGGKVAMLVAIDLDAKVFAEILNADQTFDTGDVTTLSSTGVPIDLSSTTVPQMVARMPAKLKRANNQVLTNQVFVIDAYGASDVEQYLLGKSIDLAGSVFKNGYTGNVNTAEMFVSENLTGSATLEMATQPTAADTVVFNGVTFQFVASIGNPGDLHIGSAVDDTRANMANALNAVGTAIAEDTETGYTVLSAADQLTFNALNITATNDDTNDELTIIAKGSGRLTLTETFSDGTDEWADIAIHCYYGKRGGIDLVIQDLKSVDMRKTADRRGTNVFSSYLAGLKTFDDGSRTFLNVLIDAA